MNMFAASFNRDDLYHIPLLSYIHTNTWNRTSRLPMHCKQKQTCDAANILHARYPILQCHFVMTQSSLCYDDFFLQRAVSFLRPFEIPCFVHFHHQRVIFALTCNNIIFRRALQFLFKEMSARQWLPQFRSGWLPRRRPLVGAVSSHTTLLMNMVPPVCLWRYINGWGDGQSS